MSQISSSESLSSPPSAHFDRGGIREDNQRLLIHSHLSSVAPDFIPQLILPDEKMLAEAESQKGYPVENIQGLKWADLIYHPEKNVVAGQEFTRFTCADHLHIALQTLKEVKIMIENYGIVLKDRNLNNVIVAPTQESGHFSHDQNQWKVWQVDLEEIYDAVTGENTIGNQVDLSERKNVKPENMQDPQRTEKELSKIVRSVFDGLNDMRRRPEIVGTMSPQLKRELDSFFLKYKSERFSEVDGPVIHLNDSITILDGFLSLQKTQPAEKKRSPLLRSLRARQVN
jgi:hypothetical protein